MMPAIEGVATSTAGFVGPTECGPTTAQLVTSWVDYERMFGAALDPAVSFLPFAVRGFFDNGGRRAFVARVGGAGAALSASDFIGDPSQPEEGRTGLAALAAIDEISLVAVPDEVNPAILDRASITSALVDHCEQLRDRFAILSMPQGQSAVHGIVPPAISSYAAVYYPWIRVLDPRTKRTLLVPSHGHIAGIYARTDIERGVHHAPANAVVRGIVDDGLDPPLEFTVGKTEQDLLNPRGVNVIRDFRADGRGVRVWGARTTSADSDWKYVNVRRLLMYLEQSIATGTRWVVFEPNAEPAWTRLRQEVENFLTTEWRLGALPGTKPEQAFFVRCGRDTMTQDDIDNGRLIAEIGVATIKPAEFVVFRIGQQTSKP
jgi:phage tail sheath protein FI